MRLWRLDVGDVFKSPPFRSRDLMVGPLRVRLSGKELCRSLWNSDDSKLIEPISIQLDLFGHAGDQTIKRSHSFQDFMPKRIGVASGEDLLFG